LPGMYNDLVQLSQAGSYHMFWDPWTHFICLE